MGTALVLIRPRSVPQCGSVRFMVPVQRPSTICGQVELLLLLGAVDEQSGERAMRSGPDTCRRPCSRTRRIRSQRSPSVYGRPWPPYSGSTGEPDPAAVGIGLVGFLETLRRGDALLVRAARSPRGRLTGSSGCSTSSQSFAASPRIASITSGRRVGEARQVVVAFDLEDVVQQEQARPRPAPCSSAWQISRRPLVPNGHPARKIVHM